MINSTTASRFSRLGLAVLAVLFVATFTSTSHSMASAPSNEITLWAPPAVWSPSYTIFEHTVPRTIKVSLDPIGATQIRGEITFFNKHGKKETYQFYNDTMIQVSDCGAVTLRLKGVPLGSAVIVTVKE